MTKVIKRRKSSHAIPFLIGFLCGFLFFVCMTISVFIYAYYGASINTVENMLGKPIIEGENYTYLKTMSINDIVKTFTKMDKLSIDNIEKGFQISFDENLLGFDINQLDKYVKEYSEYESIKEIGLTSLPSVMQNFAENVSTNSLLEILNEFGIYDATKTLNDLKLDELSVILNEYLQGKKIIDFPVKELPKTMLNLSKEITLSKVIETLFNYDINIENELNKLNLDGKTIINALKKIFEDNNSIYDTIKDYENQILAKELSYILGIEKNIMQFMPILDLTKVSKLNEFLANNLSNLVIEDLIKADDTIIINIDSQILSENKGLTICDYAKLCNSNALVKDIITGKGIFNIHQIKNAKISDLNKKETYSQITLSQLALENIVSISPSSLLFDLLDKTLQELEDNIIAQNENLVYYLTFKTGILYQPNVYTLKIKDLFNIENIYNSILLNFSINDIDRFNLNLFNSGILSKLDKSLTVKEFLSGDLEIILRGITVGDIVGKTKEDFSGIMKSIYDIYVTELIYGDTLDAVGDIYIGEILELEKDNNGDFYDPQNNTSQILINLSSKTINDLISNLDNIKVGEILGLKFNKDINDFDKNENVQEFLYNLRNLTIGDLTIDLSNTLKKIEIGYLLGFEKEDNKYIFDEKTKLIIKNISYLTLDEILNDTESLLKIVKMEDIFELIPNLPNGIKEKLKSYSLYNIKTDLDSILNVVTVEDLFSSEFTSETEKLLLAIKDFTLKELIDDPTAKIYSIKIGDILYGDNSSSLYKALSEKTFGDLINNLEEIVNDITVAQFLDLKDENSDGIYDTTNKLVLAFANTKIGELTTKMETLTIGEVLGLKDTNLNGIYEKQENIETSNLILSLASTKVNELESKINSMTIGEALGLNDENNNGVYEQIENENQSVLILQIAPLKITELSGDNLQTKLNCIKLGEFLQLDYDDENDKYLNSKNLHNMLFKMSNYTLNEIQQENTLNDIVQTLTIQDIFTNELTGIMSKIDNQTTIASLDTSINNLKVLDLFPLEEGQTYTGILALINDQAQNITISNLNTLQIDITTYTMKELKEIGLISYGNDFKFENYTIQEIIELVNNSGIIPEK